MGKGERRLSTEQKKENKNTPVLFEKLAILFVEEDGSSSELAGCVCRNAMPSARRHSQNQTSRKLQLTLEEGKFHSVHAQKWYPSKKKNNGAGTKTLSLPSFKS